jgi:hypothetical protein
MGKTYRRDSDRKYKNFGKSAAKAKKIREDFSPYGSPNKHHSVSSNNNNNKKLADIPPLDDIDS